MPGLGGGGQANLGNARILKGFVTATIPKDSFQPQECKIKMTVEKLANTTVRLLAEEVRYCHTQVCRCRRILGYARHTFSAPLMIKIMRMIINCDDNNGSSRTPFFLLSHKDPS